MTTHSTGTREEEWRSARKRVHDPGNVLRRNQNIPPPATVGHAAAATRLGRNA